MAMTKVKGKMHYCPNCGGSAEDSLKVLDIDAKQREIGRRNGYPYYGTRIQCVKCEWSGEWFIPKEIYNKMNAEYQQYMDSNATHFKRNEFGK